MQIIIQTRGTQKMCKHSYEFRYTDLMNRNDIYKCMYCKNKLMKEVH